MYGDDDDSYLYDDPNDRPEPEDKKQQQESLRLPDVRPVPADVLEPPKQYDKIRSATSLKGHYK
jgi:hypothetical protein